MALPQIVGAGLKAAKAAKKLKGKEKAKAKDSKVMSKKEFEEELKKPETKARMKAESEKRQKEFSPKIDKRIKETKKNKPKASFQDLLEATEDVTLKKGGLARRKRKSDGGLKVGQRKIARGCGKVQRRKKTLYR
tara:strand:- start:462 stop:866 length:405 start_codon:yes stop_codon:yes gene_type:complete